MLEVRKTSDLVKFKVTRITKAFYYGKFEQIVR